MKLKYFNFTPQSWAWLCLVFIIGFTTQVNARQCNSWPYSTNYSDLVIAGGQALKDAANPSCINSATATKGYYSSYVPHFSYHVTNLRAGNELIYNIDNPLGIPINNLKLGYYSNDYVFINIMLYNSSTNQWIPLEFDYGHATSPSIALEGSGGLAVYREQLIFNEKMWPHWASKLKIIIKDGYPPNIATFKLNTIKFTYDTSHTGTARISNNKLIVTRPVITARLSNPSMANADFEKIWLEMNDLFNNVTTFPNPATDQMNFKFTIPQDGHAKLSLYNAIGQEVQVITNGMLTGGPFHQFNTDVSNLEAGMYIYRLETSQGPPIVGKVQVK
jgi:hypothetical protein